MKRLICFSIILTLLVSIIQCTPQKRAAIPQGCNWRVTDLNLEGTGMLAPTPPLEEEQTPAYLIFDDSLKLGGYTGCNIFFGKYRYGEAGSISLKVDGMTRMAGKQMFLEQNLLRLIPMVTSYSIKDSILTLYGADKEELIRLDGRKGLSDLK